LDNIGKGHSIKELIFCNKYCMAHSLLLLLEREELVGLGYLRELDLVEPLEQGLVYLLELGQGLVYLLALYLFILFLREPNKQV